MTTDNNANAAVEVGVLCPRCDYDLRGLPRAGRCPECGLRFNERSCGWETPLTLARLQGLILVLALVISGVQGYRLATTRDTLEMTMQGLLLAGVLIGFAAALLPIWLGHRYVLAACAEGLLVRRPWQRTRYIPYDQIIEIRAPEHPTIPNIVVELKPQRPNQPSKTIQIRCHRYTRPQVDAIIARCVDCWQYWQTNETSS